MSRPEEHAIRWPIIGALVSGLALSMLFGFVILPLVAVALPFYFPMLWLAERSR